MRNFLSLGGGVQSTAMLLMALHGEFDEFVDCAIFADTGWEREATYRNVAFLRAYADGFGVPVVTVSNGNIREDALGKGARVMPGMPMFVKNKVGNRAMLRRQCTNVYKVRPINQFIRSLGASADDPACSWIGISVDEASRMKPSRVKYIETRFPLVEKRLGRDSCYQWLVDHGFAVPPKSACVGCPMHSDASWGELSDAEVEDAGELERGIQARGMKYFDDDALSYLHPSMVPITERPFDVGVGETLDFLENEECEGGCFL